MEERGDNRVTNVKSTMVKCDRFGKQALSRVRKLVEKMEMIADQMITLQEEEGENVVMMSSDSALSTSLGGEPMRGEEGDIAAKMETRDGDQAGKANCLYSDEIKRMKDRVDAQGRIRDDMLKYKAESRELLEMVHKELVRMNNVENIIGTEMGAVRSLNVPPAIVESLEVKTKETKRENVCLEKDGKVLIEEVVPLVQSCEPSSGCKDGSARVDGLGSTSHSDIVSESLGGHLIRVMGLYDVSLLSRDGGNSSSTVRANNDAEDDTWAERLRNLMPWNLDDGDVDAKRWRDIQCVLIVCNHIDSLSHLVDSMLPRLLGEIYHVVTANVQFHRNQKHATRMESYRGPSASARAACAVQLVWTLQNCSLLNLYDDELEMIGKTVLDGSNDTSYIVRNICMAAAELCVIKMPDDKMHFLSKYIVPLVRASVEANDAQCWTQTYHLASAVLNRYPNRLSDIMPGVVEQLFRNQHRLEYAVNWVEAMRSCFVPIGIPLIEYSSTILPILLEWIQSHDDNLQQKALHGLSLYLRACWPRNERHADVIWPVLEHVFDRHGGADKMPSDTMQHLKECCCVLWVTAGKEFRNGKRESSSPTWLVTHVSKTYDAT